MSYQGPEDLKSVPHSSRAPRKVRHEDLPPRTHHAPGEGSEGGSGLAPPENGLGQPFRHPFHHRPGRLRGHVPGAEPGPTCGEDDVHFSSVDPSQEERHDLLGQIRDGGPEGHLVTLQATPFLYGSPTSVLPLSPATGIGDGEDPDPEGFGIHCHQRLIEPSV